MRILILFAQGVGSAAAWMCSAILRLSTLGRRSPPSSKIALGASGGRGGNGYVFRDTTPLNDDEQATCEVFGPLLLRGLSEKLTTPAGVPVLNDEDRLRFLTHAEVTCAGSMAAPFAACGILPSTVFNLGVSIGNTLRRASRMQKREGSDIRILRWGTPVPERADEVVVSEEDIVTAWMFVSKMPQTVAAPFVAWYLSVATERPFALRGWRVQSGGDDVLHIAPLSHDDIGRQVSAADIWRHA